MTLIRTALVGIGNCASSLVQGVEYYRRQEAPNWVGLMHPDIGGFSPADLKFVAAFDVDARKVGLPLEQAVFAKPNCVRTFCHSIDTTGVNVKMGPILDGIADHMADYPVDEAFRPAQLPPENVVAALRECRAEVLICYLPVGSNRAVEFYAEACIEAGVAMVNCVPTFIASDPVWAERFHAAGLPIVGDDVKSQLGATVLHRQLASLFADRGVAVDHTYQLNTGGNSDFLNMLERKRLASKKISKTEAVQSQLIARLADRDIHIGPSDYVAWQKDNKVCFIRLEGRGFGDAPIELELRLSVQDSPNSSGAVIDAVRCVQVARRRGLVGPLEAVSARYMKSPPVQMRESEARVRTEAFING